jgi:hypothetical protein
MFIYFHYSAFYINLMHNIGGTDLINFRCLAILLAQQAVRYVKQSKQSALISGNVACRDSEVNTVTGYWLNGLGYKFHQRQKMLSCPKLFNGYEGFS